jgi:exosortase/archaeosortase family protein
VPTATANRQSPAAEFVVRALAGSLAAFALLRLSWTDAHVILPVTQMQGAWAQSIFGTPAGPVTVTTACSGADAIALCAGAVLAYPVAWRARLAGLAGGLTLILALNTVRIGTLGLMVASPRWFGVLHVYIWPTVLTLAIAAYVFTWMRIAGGASHHLHAGHDRHPLVARLRVTPSRRFIVLTATLVVLFAAASPLYLDSRVVLAAGAFMAQVTAAILVTAGIGAHAAGHILVTTRGAFSITQECIMTPLIPVYLAAVCAYSTTRTRMIAGIFATLPLFTALGIARVLLVAVPATLVSAPAFLVHAFYQLLLGAVVVYVAATWRHGRTAAPFYAAAGLAAGLCFVWLLGPAYAGLVTPPASRTLDDPQGAVAFLPVFQASLYLALCVAAFVSVRWKRVVTGFGLLALTQIAGLLALQALAAGGISAQVRDLRAWAVLGPVVIFAALMSHARPGR